MCGIVGYVGRQTAAPLLLAGLRRLEYRGYDSAGLVTLADGTLHGHKRRGKIDDGLAPLLAREPLRGTLGIGHTRWATHGPPTDANAHPHFDASGRLALVHNGVIENHETLKRRLLAAGHTFRSDTDTEVLAHWIGAAYADPLLAALPPVERLPAAVARALQEVHGTYGLAILCADTPELMLGARRGSPLILGLGQGENFLASDATAMVAHTREVVYLQDGDLVVVTPEHYQVTNPLRSTPVQVSHIDYAPEAAERGPYPHFMLKEICEQPETIANALRGRLDPGEATAKFGGLNMTPAELRAVDRIVITACGTSWHAGLVGEHYLESLAHLPVEVEYASEFRYRNPPLDKHTLVLVITQSGETADTLAALREARRRGHRVLALCNVVGSTIAREADGGIYLHAGPEIGVASTKAFTSQVTVLLLLALYLGRLRGLAPDRGLAILQALEQAPELVRKVLTCDAQVRALAARYADRRDFYFLGRQLGFPVALEGALKLKEISYLHAEGYPAAEMKHGPIALMDAATPCVFVAPRGFLYEKLLGNIEEVRARGAPVIALATEGDSLLAGKAAEVIALPAADPCLLPLLAVVPLQLLAYHMAVLRGCDVDKPRNLAKSVTVE